MATLLMKLPVSTWGSTNLGINQFGSSLTAAATERKTMHAWLVGRHGHRDASWRKQLVGQT
jgi:hypothetical protein